MIKKEMNEHKFDKKIIIVLIAIIILTILVRSYYISSNNLMEPDAYYHARMVKYIIEQGELPKSDPLTYYQLGGAPTYGYTIMWPLTAITYQVITLGSGYSFEKFIPLLMVLPILFSIIIILLLYILGKEFFESKKIGLIMGFVFAILPATVYRTIAGYFEDDAMGFIPLLIGLIFFFRATKTNTLNKKDLINSILAGTFFLLLALTWRMYVLIPLTIIPLICIGGPILTVTNKKTINSFNQTKFFYIKALIPLVILVIGGLIFGINVFDYISNQMRIIMSINSQALTVSALVGATIIISYILAKIINKTNSDTKEKILFTLTLILCIGIMAELLLFSFVPALKNPSNITNYVTEEGMGVVLFLEKFGFLLIFIPLTIVIAPISIYLRFSDPINTLFCFILTAITLFMGWYILKLSFVMGFGLVIAIGFCIQTTLLILNKDKQRPHKNKDWLITTLLILNKDKQRPHKNKDWLILLEKLASICIIFILLTTMAWGFEYVKYTPPYLDTSPEWINASNWIKENTPIETKLFNWWDQGHILTFLAERKVSTDNINWPCPTCEPNKAMAKFVTTSDINKAYKIAALDVNADYIILSHHQFTTLQTYYDYSIGKIDTSETPQFPRENKLINCTNEGNYVTCDQYIFTKEEFNSLKTVWTKEKTSIDGESSYMYKSEGNLLILTNQANNTNLAKIWLHSTDTTNLYEEAYSKEGVKILKIIK
jgi:asparagine N-glycosylation enzyme membrane subunit Stt3